MDSIWKVALTILIAISIVITGTSIVSAGQDVITANNYFDDLSAVICESNYNDNVINQCITEAQDNGYVLTVNVIGNPEPGTKKYAEVTLQYTYSMPLFGVSEVKTKSKII